MAAVAQSLAGRAGHLTRDVRDLVRIGDLATFSTFLRLCAGRTGQEVNLSALGADAGVSQPTARAWLSALEAIRICFRVPRWPRNLTSQAVKAPKVHFFDTGLVCYLLGIREPDQLRYHPLRGASFESWVAAEIYKQRAHAGLAPDLFHHRDAQGAEVDLILSEGGRTLFLAVKSGETPYPALLRPLARLAGKLAEPVDRVVVHGGDTTIPTADGTLLGWRDLVGAASIAPYLRQAWAPAGG